MHGNTSTGTTLSMLKIYKYTEYKVSYFLIFQHFCLPNGLLTYRTAIRPGSTMPRAPVFSHNKSNRIGFTKLLFERKFIDFAMMLPFILYKLAFIFKSLTERSETCK